MSKLLFYDVETTGLNPELHAIHQISGIIVINNEKKLEFDIKCAPHPTALIELEALKVSNVTEEQIKGYQANIFAHKELLSKLSRFCNKYDKLDKFHLIGYNNRGFDDSFFRQFFNHSGDKYYGSWFWNDTNDVMGLASAYLQEVRGQLDNFQLRTVAKFLGIEVDETKLHDASYDIWLTWQIYEIVKHPNPRK